MDKQALLKQKTAIEQAAIELREQRAAHAADLVKAKGIVADETAAGIAARLRRMTHNPKKLQDAQTDLELLPSVIAELDRKIIEVQAPLAGIEHDLARLQYDADRAALEKDVLQFHAAMIEKVKEHRALVARFNALADVPPAVIPRWERNLGAINNALADVAALSGVAGDLRYLGLLK